MAYLAQEVDYLRNNYKLENGEKFYTKKPTIFNTRSVHAN